MKSIKSNYTCLVIALAFFAALTGCEKVNSLVTEVTKTTDESKGEDPSVFEQANQQGVVAKTMSFEDYKKNAEAGSAEDQFIIAEKYYKGEQTPRNYVEASKWYAKAAYAGHTNAQFHLAKMHYEGNGVAKDIAEAYAWVNLAASQGHADAKKSRDKLEKRLTTYEIRRAQDRSLAISQEIASPSKTEQRSEQ